MPFLTCPRRVPLVFAGLVLSSLPALAQQWTEDHYQSSDKDAPYYRRPIAGYIPSVAPAVFAAALFGILAITSWVHYARNRMLVWLPIGLTGMTLGIALRVGVHSSPYSVGIYAISNVLALVSPCCFLAVCYQLLGRMALTLGPDVARDCLPIRQTRITKIFVTSDIITFIILAGGSGMQVIGGNIATYAHWAALGGLGIQAASFLLFCIFLAIFAMRVRHRQPQAWRRSDGSFTWSPARLFTRSQTDDWRVVLRCTIAASFFLTVRNIFRVFEYVEGFDGAIATNETLLYLLDSLPIFLGVAPFVYFWPRRFLVEDVYVHVEHGRIGSPISMDIPLKTAYR